MKIRLILAAIATVAALPASANTIKFYDDASVPSGERFSLTCSLGCEAALFDAEPSTYSSSVGGLIDFPGGGGIQAVFDATTGETDLTVSGEILPANDFDFSWVSDALYTTFKIGTKPNFAIVKNTGGAGNMFTFKKLSTGSGFSHYREAGVAPDVTPIPLPAGAGLLMVALGALGVARRARKA